MVGVPKEHDAPVRGMSITRESISTESQPIVLKVYYDKFIIYDIIKFYDSN